MRGKRREPIQITWDNDLWLSSKDFEFIQNSTIFDEIEFWTQNTDWDSDVYPNPNRNYLSWSSQVFLKFFFNDVMDESRPDLDKRVLSCLMFIHLLNHNMNENELRLGGSPTIKGWKFGEYMRRNAQYGRSQGLFGDNDYQIPKSEWDEMFTDLPFLTMGEMEKYRIAAKLMKELRLHPISRVQQKRLGIIIPRGGGDISSIPDEWVALIYRSVLDMEQRGGLLVGTLRVFDDVVRNDNRMGSWYVPIEQILSDAEVNLYPFSTERMSLQIFSYNYAVKPNQLSE